MPNGLQIQRKQKGGFVLLLGIIAITAIVILSASQFERVANFVRFGNNKVLQGQAISLAEAGVDYALWQLNENAGDWYDSDGEVNVGTSGTFFVTVTDATANIKNVVATGYIPNSINPRKQITVKTQVVIDNQTIAFNYAAQTDLGGVEMYSNAVVNGNVYTNGNITGFSNSRINGEAWAAGTISSPDPTITVPPPHPNQATKDLPTFVAQYWKDAANINNDPYIGNLEYNSGSHNLGPRKIEGNLTLNSNSWVTLQGPVHVTGNFAMNSNTRLYLDESFGTTGTVVIVDGTIQLNSNAEVFSTSATPKGYIILASTSTSSTAIELNSNAKAGVLYALSGTLQINSNGTIVAMAANKLVLNSNATLTYDEGLASAQFSGGPGGSWQIRKGSYQYTK
ncbi:hypothetical protein A3D04_01060 [Candidatus Curtissbacteria bacterium RIFCSPHIGHO2_02_FULL_40_16b]|uniref:Type 4 fimbrial biogenesis protein PilX N-terminal domain-containing protein n=1 Tax=Candidatus Curtissbacteria bacterium RIFCSPHIGHO2_02_FULL_40_16b TaxID=1797714 RepID=A0A1F5G972_9BACT|nr:MAG: hypothetical protein A3D04_01060 [Candidatus Curtissbacteria bacterium RIFCSPHIGHO2_02_FULL_40_16b]